MKKKVALIIWGLQISGGGARQILELALSLKRKGHHVDIFCVDLDREKCYPHLLKQLKVYPVNESTKKQTHHLAKYGLLQKIFNIIPHFINKKHNLLQLRDLIKKHDAKVHYDFFNYHETEVYKLSSYFNTSKNFWMMNDLFINGASLPETLYRRWTHVEFRIKYRTKINKTIVLDNINRLIIRKYLHSDAVVVRSGLEQKSFYLKRVYKPKKNLSILATGIFFPHRRFEDIVKAMNILVNKKGLKNVTLSIIGETKTDLQYFLLIESLVKKYHLESSVNFLGRVTEEELKNQYKTSDIFVFPNSPQTWGLAVFEAILSGCVAIVSRGAGAHEVLHDNQTAMLVDPESPKQIAKKIEILFKNYHLRKKIAIAGQDFVKKTISWDKYAEEMLSIFSQN
ncbi:MAG: glycosyltransferase family 4 protein [Candidatus Levybacteria bacterium]|nr:glycosyltransferase family 4 protein [Candidatus Levybacteria bacterium]